MRRLWLVAKHEYLKRVRQKSFLLLVIGIPVLIFGVGGISVMVTIGSGDGRPVGYVDRAGVLHPGLLTELAAKARSFTEFCAYGDEMDATTALEAGEIQAFYIVPEAYLTDGQLRLTYGERAPRESITQDFRVFLRGSLVARQPAEVRPVLADGFSLTVRSGDGRRELAYGQGIGFLVPFIATFFLYFAVMSAGGYLLQAVTDEKENRTMEILTTSVSPLQLMSGKALGLMGVSLTQILAWVGALVVAAVVGARFFEPLRALTVPWTMLGLAVLFFVPTFALIAGLMTTIGAAVTELQQAQQISGIINLLFVIPMFFVALIFSQPDSPFLVVLTLLPTSAFLTVLFRWSLTAIPAWQIVVSWLSLTCTALGSVWLAARVFRMGMLRYGQRLRLRTILEGLRRPRMVRKEVINENA